MALSVHSKFYFGIQITADNRYLNFIESADEISTTLDLKGYTLEEIAFALQTALNAAGLNEYEVSVDRTTRKLTITADGDFEILATSGVNAGQGAWPTLGWTVDTEVDSGDETESATALGSVWVPQFPLQEYLSPERNSRALSAVVSKSASGRNVSVQTFGSERFAKFNAHYITDIRQPVGHLIRDDSAGVDNAIAFLEYMITKEKFQFMPDENDVNTFYDVIAESTSVQQDGTGYELREWYDRSLPGYFETGLITLKVID